VPDSARAALRYQFIIDSLDVWLPAANLGLINLSDGVLGFTGYVFLLGSPHSDVIKLVKYCHIHYGAATTMAVNHRAEISTNINIWEC
jgi:hypothetical protein